MLQRKNEKAAHLKALKLMEMRALTKRDVVYTGEFATLCCQGDVGVEEVLDHCPPLHLATAYEMRDDMDNPWVYSRNSTPTRERLEKIFGLLEGSVGDATPPHALVFASGMAAISTTLLNIKIDALWLVNVGYTGTHSFIRSDERLRKACVTTFEELVAHPGPRKVIYCESVRNPDANLVDLNDLATKAKEVKATLVCDSTFATPVLCKPLSHGAHVVIHSCSKFIGGHSDVLAGVAVFRNVEHYLPVRSARLHQGAILGNLETILLLRSLKTLSLRVKRHAKSARKIAVFLAGQKDIIEYVRNGALDQPQIWRSMVSNAGVVASDKAQGLAVPCFTFCFKRSDHASAFQRQLFLFANCTSLGGACSSMDHRSRWDTARDEREFRISVGLEDPKDLIADLDRVFHALRLLTITSNTSPLPKTSLVDSQFEC